MCTQSSMVNGVYLSGWKGIAIVEGSTSCQLNNSCYELGKQILIQRSPTEGAHQIDPPYKPRQPACMLLRYKLSYPVIHTPEGWKCRNDLIKHSKSVVVNSIVPPNAVHTCRVYGSRWPENHITSIYKRTSSKWRHSGSEINGAACTFYRRQYPPNFGAQWSTR